MGKRVAFISKRKETLANDLIEWIADADWTIVVSKKGDDTSVAYFDMTNELEVIGALNHAIFKMHKKLEGVGPDV